MNNIDVAKQLRDLTYDGNNQLVKDFINSREQLGKNEFRLSKSVFNPAVIAKGKEDEILSIVSAPNCDKREALYAAEVLNLLFNPDSLILFFDGNIKNGLLSQKECIISCECNKDCVTRVEILPYNFSQGDIEWGEIPDNTVQGAGGAIVDHIKKTMKVKRDPKPLSFCKAAFFNLASMGFFVEEFISRKEHKDKKAYFNSKAFIEEAEQLGVPSSAMSFLQSAFANLGTTMFRDLLEKAMQSCPQITQAFKVDPGQERLFACFVEKKIFDCDYSDYISYANDCYKWN